MLIAKKALEFSKKFNYKSGVVESLNNIAFVEIARMNYQSAQKILNSILNSTNNQVELLIANIQQMRLCQRMSLNKNFYDYREQAERQLNRISEEIDVLSPHQRKRYTYAKSEFYIVMSTYLYYVGLKNQSAEALKEVKVDNELLSDTAQYLNYLYNIGAGDIISEQNKTFLNQEEFNYLIKCYALSLQHQYTYWEANSLQSISEHIINKTARNQIIHNNPSEISFLNSDDMPDSLLAGNLAEKALILYEKYGDNYQKASGYRTLAECYWAIADYKSALICLQKALKDKKIEQAPDLVASIREKLSIVYAAINDKRNSDINRNKYLDLQENTRQDRELESRVDHLRKSLRQLNFMIYAVLLLIIIIIILLIFLDKKRKNGIKKYSRENFMKPLQDWKKRKEKEKLEYLDEYEQISEKIQVANYKLFNNKKRFIEQKAKISLIISMNPFIDRIIREVSLISTNVQNEQQLEYVKELAEKIKEYNDIITKWIQLKQGQISLNIENFELQSVFYNIAKNKTSFSAKGISLVVKKTNCIVKADKILTLFMLNTLADNAKKYTSKNGIITIGANDLGSCIEIFVEDTGCGINEEFLHKLLDEKSHLRIIGNYTHGYGLMNCKDIIERYRKISKLFSVCKLTGNSRVGKGSVFKFTLPKGTLRKSFMLLTFSFLLWPKIMKSSNSSYNYIDIASSYADSAYYANIAGRYESTIQYGDSCIKYLNKRHAELNKNNYNMKLYSYSAVVPSEIIWFRNNEKLDYYVILDIRNEIAVAALALNKWQLYQYNNEAYTQLFRELSADNSLKSYIKIMKKSQTNKGIAVFFLCMLLLCIFPAYYFLYYRHQLNFRISVDCIIKINKILQESVSSQKKINKILELRDSKKNRIEEFEMINQVIGKIISTLKLEVLSSKKNDETLELVKDELHRISQENEMFYISNSIIDNCLSSFKHETMYYPAKILSILSNSKDIDSIRELMQYYKVLYKNFCLRTFGQIREIKYSPKAYDLDKFFAKKVSVDRNVKIWVDKDLMLFLLSIIENINNKKEYLVSLDKIGEKYIDLLFTLQEIGTTSKECKNLFLPSQNININFLLVKQIIREFGNMTNARRCGVVATMDVRNKLNLKITLAKYIE